MPGSRANAVAHSLLLSVRMKLASLLLLAPLTTGCADQTGSSAEALLHAPGACGDIETHVIGVMSNPQTVSTVILKRKGKHALVLSSHDAMTWHVKTSNGAVLEHVYAVGYGKQTVEVDGKSVDVITDSMTEDGIAACGTAMGDTSNGCDAESLMILASKRVHHDVTSFHGCTTATTWTIGADMGTTSDCAAKTQDDWAGGCKPGGDDTGCGPGGGGSGSGSGGGGGDGQTPPLV